MLDDGLFILGGTKYPNQEELRIFYSANGTYGVDRLKLPRHVVADTALQGKNI